MTDYRFTWTEKFFGKHYKWIYLLKYEIKLGTTYLISDFLWMLGKMASLVFIILVWSFSDSSENSQVMSYLIIGNIVFAVSNVYFAWPVNNIVHTGKISSFLLSPSNLFVRWFLEALPMTIKLGLCTLVVVLPLSLFFSEYLTFTPRIWLLLPFLISAYIIRFFIDISIGLMSFWVKDAYGIIDSSIAILPFFAGSLIPFYFFGNFPFKFLLDLNPLAFTFYHPMQIYLDNYDETGIWLTILGSIAWCVILWLLARRTLFRGLKRNESVGL